MENHSQPMNNNIRFSIVIPVYNREILVQETINSVLAQDFPAGRTEIIVADDGSTDRTREVLTSYGSLIKMLHHSNQGAEATKHYGASVARGEYIVLLDSDDLLFPWALSLYDHIMRSLDNPSLVISQVVNFSDGEPVLQRTPENDLIEVYKYPDYLAREITVGQTCSRVIVKRSVAERTGVFRPKATAFPFDITDMLLLLGDSSPCVIVNRPYSVAYRVHASNTVQRTDYMVRSFPRLIELERDGSYPGGTLRRFERQALIGAMAWNWVRIASQQKKFRLVTWLLWQSGHLVTIAVLHKFSQQLRRKTPAIELGNLRSLKPTGSF